MARIIFLRTATSHPPSPAPWRPRSPPCLPLPSTAPSSGLSTRHFLPSSQHHQPWKKTAFHGVSLVDSRWLRSGGARRRLVQVNAKTAGAAKNIEVEVDKPLGLTLGQKSGGGVVITGVESGGNAARAGLKSGDQVLYTSSFFGDELWPADKLGFTKTAIQAKPDSVYFVVSRGGGDIDVKRLPKRPAPPRFGRKLSDSQKARATHICLDCGYIYFLPKAFEEQPDEYGCPQCNAPKKRFARYDVESGKPIGGALPPLTVIVSLVIGIAGIGALLVYGLQ
ncbi:uncharacterized protein [Triticum aestivum]|uniref:uncharacterized protein isoform X1 n=1 Tax=Triticum aestivum TaxID=4565 RepID=UPI001D029FC9|nr:uncharacterized protein LOC123169153 isoform X1 [Triticum aestivum]